MSTASVATVQCEKGPLEVSEEHREASQENRQIISG